MDWVPYMIGAMIAVMKELNLRVVQSRQQSVIRLS